MSRRGVLFVHHRPQASGAARSLALLIGALDPSWEPHVLAPGGAAAALFRRSGATVHEGPVPAFTHTWDVSYHGLRWLVAAREAAWAPQHHRQLRRLIRELRPAVVHVNDVVMVVSAVTAARAGAPVVWHLRSSLPDGGRDRRSRWIANLIDRYAAAAVAIDEDVARSYPLRMPIDVVPNPVAVDDVDAAPLPIPAGRVSLGFFGYLRRQKGWPQFLRALRSLSDDGLEVQGVFVGGGVRPHGAFRGLRGPLLKGVGVPDEEADLERLVHELQLDDRVTRLPFTEDIGAVMRALDIVVFPNQGAGLGRPVIEAAAYGVPVVASGSRDGGGVVEPNVTALLVGPDEHELAEALKRLVSDPVLRSRLGAEAARKAAALAPSAVAARVAEIWARVLGDRQAAAS